MQECENINSGIYIPELIFSHLLTSTNYDKVEKKSLTGGKFGIGIKAVNIFSKKFIVETKDEKHKYVQVFENNMFTKHEPVITKSKMKQYTQVTFYPDLEKFGLKEISDDMYKLFLKRVYDIAGCINHRVKIKFNNELINIKSFNEYIWLYYDEKTKIIYEETERWKVGIVFDEHNNHNVSFVNSICTYINGTHYNYIINQIIKYIDEYISKKYKILKVKPSQIKDNLSIFIDCQIENPSFNSQVKDCLTTKPNEFGSTCILSQEFLDKLCKSGIIELIVNIIQNAELRQLKKTDGSLKKNMLLDIPKLEDALNVLNSKNKENTRIILTEGDSAKSFALNGRTVLGIENFGVYPLKGKILNVRNATLEQCLKNEEIVNIKKILGLKHDMVYTSVKQLRYGGIIILTDSDVDGSHIKGLIINLFQYFWPELLVNDGFIQTISTPLIKAFLKTDKRRLKPIEFYTESDYREWKKKVNEEQYNIKYYKGLGTSKAEEAKELFREYDKRIISYKWEKTNDEEIDEIESTPSEKTRKKRIKKKKKMTRDITDDIKNSQSYKHISLAFDKEKVTERKEWLENYDKDDVINSKQRIITYSDFVNKDLKHFSNYDNERSIPAIMDGLKTCQRKILYTCIKHKLWGLNKLIKVEQLASQVSIDTAYKHGEESLKKAIIGMAQNYINSNNINLLYPDSEFGTRRIGGEDHGAPRYIFCCLEDRITQYIFRDEDECILKYIEDEGKIIEPECFYPIIPMILVNGSKGIGTGFSTDIPQYNPIDIIDNLINKLDKKENKEIKPWYRNYKGEITKINDNKYLVSGKYTIKDNNIIITEIPIKTWHDDYKEYIIKLIREDTKITNYTNKCDNDNIYFEVVFNYDDIQTFIKSGEDELLKYLKLTTTISTTNMHLHDSNNKLKKYDNIEEIFDEFYETRLNKYKIRREYYINILQNELDIIKYRVKFINQILTKEIIIERKTKEYIINNLINNKYPKLAHNIKDEKTYNYLTDLPLFSLTEEKIEELNNKLKKKTDELNKYKSLTEKDIWKIELQELKTEYNKWIIDNTNKVHEIPKKKGKKV